MVPDLHEEAGLLRALKLHHRVRGVAVEGHLFNLSDEVVGEQLRVPAQVFLYAALHCDLRVRSPLAAGGGEGYGSQYDH